MFNRRAFFTAVIGGAAAAAALAQTKGAEAATLIDQVLTPAAAPVEAAAPAGEALEMRGRRHARHHRRVAHRRHRRAARRAHRAARRATHS
ncbi:hypothetical protein E8L99_17325 [Phreatobacter aquaticus]|uniref:Protamine-2 (Modular protein) n=1 Tax=Phreatobacter aquaticus TaxID=2570229 RepID=A0A4D7QLF4_9HYPH|nr:hypothetical protein [Phreatobacter aquaticus]QCK87391.1 hypothetical protein E8L99_17325 [Phreatobacter aquaticus]